MSKSRAGARVIDTVTLWEDLGFSLMGTLKSLANAPLVAKKVSLLSPKITVFCFWFLVCVLCFMCVCMFVVCDEVSFFDVDGCHYDLAFGCEFVMVGSCFIQLKCMLICLTELVGLVYYTIGLGGVFVFVVCNCGRFLGHTVSFCEFKRGLLLDEVDLFVVCI